MRETANIKGQESDIRELEASIRSMHNDMAKINELIAKNADLQDSLANQNFNLETDFVNKLKVLLASLMNG